MGKNTQQNQNRSLLDEQRNRVSGSYNPLINQGMTDYNKSKDEDNTLRQSIQDRYSNPNSFMPAGMTPNESGWFNSPYSGQSDGKFTGGASFDPTGDFASARKGYQGFADTGNAGDFEEARGAYRDFVNNGGIGEGDAQAMRSRATDQIPAFYDAYKNSAARRANTQGGYSPGFDAQMAELGRQKGREGFAASRQIEGDIASMRQGGREFGASGLGNISGQISGNRLAGLGGLTNIGQAGQQNAQFNAGLGESNLARNQAFQGHLADLYSSNQRAGAAGLQNLYSSTPGASGQQYQQLMQALQGMYGNQLSNLGIRSGINNKSFDWSRLAGLAGGIPGFGGGGGNSNSLNDYRSGPIEGNYGSNIDWGNSNGLPGQYVPLPGEGDPDPWRGNGRDINS